MFGKAHLIHIYIHICIYIYICHVSIRRLKILILIHNLKIMELVSNFYPEFTIDVSRYIFTRYIINKVGQYIYILNVYPLEKFFKINNKNIVVDTVIDKPYFTFLYAYIGIWLNLSRKREY